jgi:hypothetical protein
MYKFIVFLNKHIPFVRFAFGYSRVVIIAHKFVIKLPYNRYGINANKSELRNYKIFFETNRLAKLYVSLPIGLMNVQEKLFIPKNWNQKVSKRYNKIFTNELILYKANGETVISAYDGNFMNFGFRFRDRRLMCCDYA